MEFLTSFCREMQHKHKVYPKHANNNNKDDNVSIKF